MAEQFNKLSDFIESEARGASEAAQLRELLVICDLGIFGPKELGAINPFGESHGSWPIVVAMLLLAFPEVHWLAVGPNLTKSWRPGERAGAVGDQPLSSILELHRDGYVSLFDPSGLRNRIRRTIRASAPSRDRITDLPLRTELAFSIDDEKGYAYFHAYTAFRFGFRSHVVTTYSMMRRLFGRAAVQWGSSFITFEDIFLCFADAERQLGYSDLRLRDALDQCPGLVHADSRIFVTTGHSRDADRKRIHENRAYLTWFLRRGQWARILFKPLPGIFTLWEQSGLKRRLRNQNQTGLASGFRWPPPARVGGADDSGHSAPGRLLEIADRLIARAERLRASTRSVADAVHGAVLATEALELLSNRTPTTALEALSLKHQFEVLAECQFYGVQSALDVKARLRDIQSEVSSLSLWFGPQNSRFSQWNAEAGILSKLIAVFRDYNRFDEEQQAQIRSRTLFRRMWFAKHRWAVLAQPLAWYIEVLLGSLPRFAVAIACWLLFLTAMYSITSDSNRTGVGSFAAAFHSFFSVQAPPGALSGYNQWVVASAILGGFVHLGVFISHLYAVISRK